MATKTQCPVCDSADTTLCISLNDVPVYCNVLYPTLSEAVAAPRGDITLMFCRDCGHLFNGTFDARKIDYSLEYENSLHYSGRFQEYAQGLAADLTERHALHNKSIVEIACGKGDFLAHICRLGGNRGFGFDPSYEPGRQDQQTLGNVEIVQDYYSDKYADIDVDLLCCRHALEHIDNPRQFLDIVRKAVSRNDAAVLYFEVPNSMYTLRDMGIWDIIYEHCGYFCENSLARVFTETGFSIDRLNESFGKQFLSIETRPGARGGYSGQTRTPLASVAEHADAFERRYAEKLATWKGRLEEFATQGKRVVVWGAGSKGVTFLNVLKAGNQVDSIVDLNPHKHAKYVPGTGHRVVSPDYLKEYRPDIVIVMNPIYKDEIGDMISGMGIDARIIVE